MKLDRRKEVTLGVLADDTLPCKHVHSLCFYLVQINAITDVNDTGCEHFSFYSKQHWLAREKRHFSQGLENMTLSKTQ